MSFDYDEIKSKEDGGSHWATYSDLFMVLSLVFLLLYVVANLRSGTASMMNHKQVKEIIRERDSLKEELIHYQNQKDSYLTSDATQKEQAQYDELMKKLTLLKDEAKEEKDKLDQAAKEQAQRYKELNRYQKMVKNIITSKIVSTVNIKRRDKTITKNFEKIDEQKEEIDSLEKTVTQKKAQIASGEKKIKRLNKSLDTKIAQLKREQKKGKISKKKMRAKIRKLKDNNSKKVAKLELQNAKAKRVIRNNQKIIAQKSQELQQAERTIAQQQSSIDQLVEKQQSTMQKISKMRSDFKSKMAAEQEQFSKKLSKQKLSAKAKEAKMRKFQAQAAAKEAEMAGKIENMESKVQSVQGQLDASRAKQAKLAAKSDALAKKANTLAEEKQRLSSDLKRMKEIANAKKKLISDMKKNLAKAGLKADVDPKSGDVVIQFGEEYFDTGKASIKPGMEKVLKKFMPEYSKTLLSDQKTAEKIKSIEIIGYASPTYRGKYVNPVSLKADNKEAMNYNMDLSYYRARSIFDYIFDTKKMRYQYQKDLLPMVKVTGKSFLAEGVSKRDVSSMTHKQYCKKYDCKKSQRVVIKFNMEN